MTWGKIFAGVSVAAVMVLQAMLSPVAHADRSITLTFVRSALKGGGFDGVYASTMVRSQQTAAPLAAALNEPVTALPGLRQVEAGQYEGQPEPDSHVTETAAWLDGNLSVRIPGSISGEEFDARFDEAVQTIYDSGDLNPIVFGHSVGSPRDGWTLGDWDGAVLS